MAESNVGFYVRPKEAVDFLEASLPVSLKHPRVAIVCGSGLGGIQDTIEVSPRVEYAFADVPHFPVPTVEGHEGKLIFGKFGSEKAQTSVVLLVGRTHFYEGYSMERVTFAARVCRLLGVEIMVRMFDNFEAISMSSSHHFDVVTNAAGGLNPSYSVGDIVLLQDHLFLAGLVGTNPLRGPNAMDFGVRFPPLSDAYDLDLRRRAHNAWSNMESCVGERKLHEGVYAFVCGPSYETRAECRMLRTLGADLVGMSTVPEILVARHAGIRVLALSLVTNNAVLEEGPRGDDKEIQKMSSNELNDFLGRGRANHTEVLQAGREAAVVMKNLVKQLIVALDGESQARKPESQKN